MSKQTETLDPESIASAAMVKMGAKSAPSSTALPDQPQFSYEPSVTGPINMAAMKPNAAVVATIQAKPSEDSKVGKAFKIARATYKSIGVKSMDKFLSLFDQIYENL